MREREGRREPNESKRPTASNAQAVGNAEGAVGEPGSVLGTLSVDLDGRYKTQQRLCRARVPQKVAEVCRLPWVPATLPPLILRLIPHVVICTAAVMLERISATARAARFGHGLAHAMSSRGTPKATEDAIGLARPQDDTHASREEMHAPGVTCLLCSVDV